MSELFFYVCMCIAIISILINISCGIFCTTKILEITNYWEAIMSVGLIQHINSYNHNLYIF